MYLNIPEDCFPTVWTEAVVRVKIRIVRKEMFLLFTKTDFNS
jgi:hypothetical protein